MTSMPLASQEYEAANGSILVRFRAALDALYGDWIERIVPFGSRARGDAQADSDYDIAVFLEGFVDRWREVDRIIPIVTDISSLIYCTIATRLSTPCPIRRGLIGSRRR